jgi:hypothetical protein
LKVLILFAYVTQKIHHKDKSLGPPAGAWVRARGRRGGPAEATIGMFTGVWEL